MCPFSLLLPLALLPSNGRPRFSSRKDSTSDCGCHVILSSSLLSLLWSNVHLAGARRSSFLVLHLESHDEQVGLRFLLFPPQRCAARLRKDLLFAQCHQPGAQWSPAGYLGPAPAFPKAWSFVPSGMNFLFCCFVPGTLSSIHCGRTV